MAASFFMLRKKIGVVVAMMVVALTALSTSPAHAEDKPLAELRSVLKDLRKGGYVIFFRHAATEHIGAPDEAADLARCETQRNLSPEGRSQALEIGKAIKTLAIPVGAVMVSPLCRTRDTAQLAFLARLKCEEYQGYYFSKPVPPENLLRLLRPALVAVGEA